MFVTHHTFFFSFLDDVPVGVVLESPFNNIQDAATSHPFAAVSLGLHNHKPVEFWNLFYLNFFKYKYHVSRRVYQVKGDSPLREGQTICNEYVGQFPSDW